MHLCIPPSDVCIFNLKFLLLLKTVFQVSSSLRLTLQISFYVKWISYKTTFCIFFHTSTHKKYFLQTTNFACEKKKGCLLRYVKASIWWINKALEATKISISFLILFLPFDKCVLYFVCILSLKSFLLACLLVCSFSS